MIRKLLFIFLFIGCQNTSAYEPSTERDDYRFTPIVIPEKSIAPRPSLLVEEIIPSPSPKPSLDPKPTPEIKWIFDKEVSWYGPGFYGKRTACGHAYTKMILGVAHRTLPCGTLVTFHWKGRTITVPVIDRGPYVKGRTWDLSGGLCVKLKHCFTGPIYYRIEK